MTEKIQIAKGENELHILPAMANRHSLITGATGTGKTITLKGVLNNVFYIADDQQ